MRGKRIIIGKIVVVLKFYFVKTAVPVSGFSSMKYSTVVVVCVYIEVM